MSRWEQDGFRAYPTRSMREGELTREYWIKPVDLNVRPKIPPTLSHRVNGESDTTTGFRTDAITRSAMRTFLCGSRLP